MWRIALLLLVPISGFAETYYLVYAGTPDVRRDGNAYTVSVEFHNNGGQAARCTAEEDNDTHQFTIRPYGNDSEKFERVYDVRPIRYGCEVIP
jgi:hypothetical protein